MSSSLYFNAVSILENYERLSHPMDYCIVSAGKSSSSGDNLYQIIEKAEYPLLCSLGFLAEETSETVLTKLVDDINELYRHSLPTLLTSYMSGFTTYIENSGLRKKAIEILNSKGATISAS